MKAGARSTSSVVIAVAMVAVAFVALPHSAPAKKGIQEPLRRIPRPKSVSVESMMNLPTDPVLRESSGARRVMSLLPDGSSLGNAGVHLPVKVGGAKAPGSRVSSGGGALGFPGIDLVTQERSGTGKYAGTGGGLEPPDQALCVGNGYVIEGVNQAFQMFSTRSLPLTPAIPLAQFFGELPGAIAGPTAFLSDPKCIYDAATKRFFATSLEIDEENTGAFTRAHNLVAVSKTSNPTKDWWVYRFDVTDDGLMGTPAHPSCPCLGDQPLIGADSFGFYISTNEYSDSEIIPVEPPPLVKPYLYKLFSLPDYRNGQAQVYAISKKALIKGGDSQPVVAQFDTADVPLPSDAPLGSVWSTLQPAHQPPKDRSRLQQNGVEFFMSQMDFATTGDNRIAVWALDNTASLNSASPSLTLQHTIITTKKSDETYAYPKSADQKLGPLTLAQGCFPDPCEEEKLNANDDRMNEVMLTNGHLWSAVNTMLPPVAEGGTGQSGDPRTGIMYFDVVPRMNHGTLTATMNRDGYVNVPRENVLFPSIGAAPGGAVIMSFTLSGIDFFPSAAWTRLDGLKPGKAPAVNISAKGAEPEDGFTGYCVQGILSNVQGQCTEGIARWGDYSASAVDESGCVWSGVEYISGLRRDANAGNWSTFVTRIPTPGCSAPAFLKAKAVNPACLPLFVGEAGSDDFGGTGQYKGKNPQMDIIRGAMSLSKDGSTLITTLTIKDLSKTIASPGGTGNVYYFSWIYKGTQYYTKVEVDVTGAVSYGDGTISTGHTDRSSGPADTGSFNPGKNGTVVVNVPTDQIGSPQRREKLGSPTGESREGIGAAGGGLVVLVDSAGPENDYTLGATCPKKH